MKKKFTLIRVPLRISFIGGGSDLPSYIKKTNHGCVISTAINKYIYIYLKRHNSEFNERIKVHLTNHVENVNNIIDLKNNIIRETLKELKFNDPVQIMISNDVRPGSGLGSSSSLIVGLIKGIYELRDLKISKKKLFTLASKIEIKNLKSPIGYQDQAAAIYGGMNYFKFTKNNIQIKKIDITKEHKNLFNKFYIYWTGKHRSANKILIDVNKNIKLNFNSIDHVKNLTEKYYKLINKKFSYGLIVKMINDSWETKVKFSNKITNSRISKLISMLKSNGADCIKLNGAGQDGYLTLSFDKRKIKKINKKINKNFLSKVKIDQEGVKVLNE